MLQKLCFSLFSLCCFTFSISHLEGQNQYKSTSIPSPTVNNFMRLATGVYDNQKLIDSLQTIGNLPQKLHPQTILCYPIWEDLKDENWLYFGWFSPLDKLNALEEMFIRIIDNEDGNTIAEWYQLPLKAKKEDAQEWLKDKPFDNIVPAEVRTEENFFAVCDIISQGTGFQLKARENGVYNLNSQYACKFMFINMFFHPEHYSSACKFYNENQEILVEQSPELPLMKISKKYKKF